MHLKSWLIASLVTLSTYGFADTVVWKGTVKADGSPSAVVTLALGQRYEIRVSGTMNLGNWWQNKEQLLNDACYEFSSNTTPTSQPAFKNSNNINVGDGKYHPDHIYQSNPFTAAQSGVHFWIHDKDYSDNSGELQVEVISKG